MTDIWMKEWLKKQKEHDPRKKGGSQNNPALHGITPSEKLDHHIKDKDKLRRESGSGDSFDWWKAWTSRKK